MRSKVAFQLSSLCYSAADPWAAPSIGSDDAGKEPQVMELVGKLGFEPVDAGPLKNARLLESFAIIWIDQR